MNCNVCVVCKSGKLQQQNKIKPLIYIEKWCFIAVINTVLTFCWRYLFCCYFDEQTQKKVKKKLVGKYSQQINSRENEGPITNQDTRHRPNTSWTQKAKQKTYERSNTDPIPIIGWIHVLTKGNRFLFLIGHWHATHI